MVTAITDGVRVSVVTEHLPDSTHVNPTHHAFTYRIRIENRSENTVQLLRRHWTIYDSNGTVREVEGEGIVGQQPVLEPGEVHEYVSGCNLKTTMGKMVGTYLMERIIDGRRFRVNVPEFLLVVPYRLN